MKPFVSYVTDYHDFDIISRAFKHAGLLVTHREIGCGRSELTKNYSHNMYHAVFFEFGTSKNEILNVIQEYKDQFDFQKDFE
jgi:hypothetical protein